MPFNFENGSFTELESFLVDKSYLVGYEPSQADVAVYKAISTKPDSASYPHSARWYKHITSFESEFSSLPGDATADYQTYGPPKASTSAPVAAIAKTVEATGGDAPAEEDDEDIDLFGSDDEEVDEAAEKLKQERLAEYAAKKAGKAKPAAKSVVTLDVKPWDDETDMKELEKSVRSIELDGLVWGLSKLVPVGYGVSKLQINMVIEDEKISLDDLQDQIAEFEEFVQSSDVQAMQKL